MRTLDDEVDPIEGRRLQLTIDYDVQKAAEDGFRALGFNGAAVALDPRTGEVLSLVEPAVVQPELVRVRHRSRRPGRRSTPTSCGRCRTAPSRGATRRARPSRSSSRPRRSRKGIVTPDFKVHCARRRNLLRPLLQVPPERRARHRGHAARDREVVQRVLLHAGQHARRRPDAQVGDPSRARREVGHRSAQRDRRPGAVDRLEASALQRKVVRRRDDLGRDRAGPGLA